MHKGVPNRCYPPSGNPLLTSWTSPESPVGDNATTTTLPPEDFIRIPSSGLLCGEVVTTEPPDEVQTVCRLYTVQTLNNPRDAVVSITNCINSLEEVHTLPPNTCLFLYSSTQPLVLDAGFGSSGPQQPSNGDNNEEDGEDGDNNDGDNEDEDNEDQDEEQEEEDNGSVTEDLDGDGIPDVGVIINPPLSCEVVLPGTGDGETPTIPNEGGDIIDGGSQSGVTASDAGTGGGSTGQPSPSGTSEGIVYDGPQASGMFCAGGDYNPETQLQTSGNWVRIASVGYGTVEDPAVYGVEGHQLPYTYKPNAVYIYDRDGVVYNSADEIYSTYVVDKIIPTIYDNEGLYTYQKHRELAFETPKQDATQITLPNDPNRLVLLWDNYKNKDVAGNPGYIIIESTSETGDGFTTPMYTFVLSDGYNFGSGSGVSYNEDGIQVVDMPENVQSVQNRPYRFILNGLDFEYGNFRVLNNLIPRNRATIIDGGDIVSPEFFSWDINEGVPNGYGWDSGTYRLTALNSWLSQTHTTYEHKLIPVNIDENNQIINHALISSEDGWYPRDNNANADATDDELLFRDSTLSIMEEDGIDIHNIFLEVVTAKSYTQQPNGLRPDGTSYMYGSGPDDIRPFPKNISTEQTKRSLFTFGPSGNFIDLLRYRSGTLVRSQPSSDYEYNLYEIQAANQSTNCFTDELGDRWFGDGSVSLNYWDTDISIIEIIYPSGHPKSISALTTNNGAPCTDIMSCCQPFVLHEKDVYSDYQDLVMQGSGYVPINFYPCTISDKVATMRGATLLNPSPEPPVTTTEGPTDGPDLIITGGLFPEFRGCYSVDGAINGKTRYRREDFAADCSYYIFWSNFAWEIWSQCGNDQPSRLLGHPVDVGDAAPTGGWPLEIIVDYGSCD